MLTGGFYLLQQIGYGVAAAVQSRITVTPVRIKPRWSWNTPTSVFFDMVFRIKNENPVGGTADGFEGTLFYANAKMGDISLVGPLSLPAEATTELTMSARLSLEELPMEIATMIQSGNFLGALRVKGTLFTSYINIPIDQNVPIA